MRCESRDLLTVANDLLRVDSPSASHANRAVSTAYYALFHHLCCTAADEFIGNGEDVDEPYLTRAKDHMIRSVSHKGLVKRMGKVQGQGTGVGFPQGIVDFANTFCDLYQRRIEADYDTFKPFSVPEAQTYVANAENAITEFSAEPKKHQKALLVWTILERRDD